MASSGNSGHLVEDLDGAFQNCLAAIMKQEHFNVTEQDETKYSVEQCVQKFADIAKQLECFFLQKRLLLSIHKPEQILKEDISELKAELQRKDTLLQKHQDKLGQWTVLLSRQSSGQTQTSQQASASTPQPPPAAQTHTQPQPQPPAPPPQTAPQPTVQLHTQMSSPAANAAQMGPAGMHTLQRLQQQQQNPQLHQQLSQPPTMGPPAPGPPPMGPPQPQGMPMGHAQQQGFPAGPLAYLEQTTSNIGMPNRRQ